MKRFLSFMLVLFCVIFLLPFSANAQENYPEWDFSKDTHEILFTKQRQYTYSYKATKDESIAFEVPYCFVNVNLSFQTNDRPFPVVTRVMNNDTVVYVLHFTAGREYYIHLTCTKYLPEDFLIKTYEWNDAMLPTILPGQTNHLSVGVNQSVSFIASVPTSGLYTISLEHIKLHASLYPYPDMSANSYPSPVVVDRWDDNGKYRYCYYMEAGVEYCLEIFGADSNINSSITLWEGDLSGRNYVITTEDPQTLTIEPHDADNTEIRHLIFCPEEDGKYCLNSNGFSVELRDSRSDVPVDGQPILDTDQYQGVIYELRKGCYYVIAVFNNTNHSKTDSVSLTPYIESGTDTNQEPPMSSPLPSVPESAQTHQPEIEHNDTSNIPDIGWLITAIILIGTGLICCVALILKKKGLLHFPAKK